MSEGAPSSQLLEQQKAHAKYDAWMLLVSNVAIYLQVKAGIERLSPDKRRSAELLLQTADNEFDNVEARAKAMKGAVEIIFSE